ncbi:MAG: hypothetical protein KDE48_15750 [Anaerolineales bacterium]|nr:hypothetical protein [Anaerolineales bacterium]
MAKHPIFKQFPITGERQISVGSVPIPYQVYDGHGSLLIGTANLTAVTRLLEGQNLFPVTNQANKGLVGIWLCDFSDASLGPHNELQLSIFAAHKKLTPIQNKPLSPLHALIEHPDTRLFCHGLWNNSERVVAFNRELLGLDAKLNRAEITRGNGRKSFKFYTANNQLICEAHLNEQRRSSMQMNWDMIRLFGFGRSARLSSGAFLPAFVVNPIGDTIPVNADAMAIIASDTPIVQYFNPDKDNFRFAHVPYANLGFEPIFMEHFSPFRFVYLMPDILQENSQY